MVMCLVYTCASAGTIHAEVGHKRKVMGEKRERKTHFVMGRLEDFH